MKNELEPGCDGHGNTTSHDLQKSQAISLKRIADALESPEFTDRLHNSLYNAISTALWEASQRK